MENVENDEVRHLRRAKSYQVTPIWRERKQFENTNSNEVYAICFESNSFFYFLSLQNEKKKRKLSDTTNDITEMKVKYLRYM